MTARDPGLQPERTRLAWLRTLLALGVNGGLIARAGYAAADKLLMFAGVLLIVLAAACVAITWRRVGQLSSSLPGAPEHGRMLLISISTAAACMGGIWAVW